MTHQKWKVILSIIHQILNCVCYNYVGMVLPKETVALIPCFHSGFYHPTADLLPVFFLSGCFLVSVPAAHCGAWWVLSSVPPYGPLQAPLCVHHQCPDPYSCLGTQPPPFPVHQTLESHVQWHVLATVSSRLSVKSGMWCSPFITEVDTEEDTKIFLPKLSESRTALQGH